MPTIGHEYTHTEVGEFYNHDTPRLSWVLIQGKRIKALRLREDYNPNIFNPRAEVWVGADSPTKEWGSRLARHTAKVPVFVKKARRTKYIYIGIHEVLSDDATKTEMALARAKVPHDRGVSRIVFLRKP